MEHYYSENPMAKHSIIRIEYNIENLSLTFESDAGVFSKTKVDYGTDVLIKTIPALRGRVLDLGCGYGPIGITLARLNPRAEIAMVDINQRAVDLANKNILLNKIENATAFQSDGFEGVGGTFDTIVTNPPIRTGKKVVYPLFEESINYLNKGGHIYVVIQKKQGAQSAMNKLTEIYGNCEAINKKGGYWILRCFI